MSEMSVSGGLGGLKDSFKELQQNAIQEKKSQQVLPGQDSSSFLNTLQGALENVNQAQVASDKAATDLALGRADNLHDVMITMEKAEIALRTATAVRNKIVEAYQEIMRMPV